MMIKVICPWVRRKAINLQFNRGDMVGIRAMTTNSHGVFFGEIGVMPWSYDWSKGTASASVESETNSFVGR
jgi:hypothetical protein